MSYEGGMVEQFDYCDADTFELGSVDSWEFRVGLRHGDFSMHVYQDPEIEGFNGLRPLKSSRNVVQFVNLSTEHKFLDVYFVKSGNTDGLDDMEDFNDDAEFNLDDDNCDGYLNEGDVNERDYARIVDEEVQESDEDEEYEEEVLDIEDLIYGKKHDCFDVGDLGAAEPNLTAAFLEQVRVADVVHDHEGDSDANPNDATRADKPTANTQNILRKFDMSVIDGDSQTHRQGNKKKYKGPYDRHGVEFRERRLTGWEDSGSDEDSDDVLGDKVCDSDFDSGDDTLDSDVEGDTLKMSEEARQKKRYIHFNQNNIKNPKLFPELIFSSSSKFKEVMTWYALVRKKDIWFSFNEKHRFGARCKYPCEWSVWLSRDKKLNDTDLVIKTMSRKHKNCMSSKTRKLVKSTWLPDMSISVLQCAVDKKYGLMIRPNQARRTREAAWKSIQGDHIDQFDMVWDYIEELKRSRPGSIVFAEYEE
ncbi:hypothetical protein LIER_40150 [Lithospermum erythrorhizon]|uniref:PB1-like domain-containing protein n=1 Tax=Lithospermum erythrorhizon TaxID=34254 RepID=A0AAV3QQ85_LITER